MRQRTKAVILFSVGAAFLVGMVLHAGVGEVVRAITSASPTHLALAVAAYAAFFLVRAFRWKMLFSRSAPDVRLSSAAGITAVGWFANSVLPLKGGEVLRAALMAKREKVGLATSASTVALERVLDLLGLAVVAALGLLLVPQAAQLPGGLARAMAVVWTLPLMALAALALAVRYREATMRFTRRVCERLGKVGEKLAGFLDSVLAGLAALSQRPRLLLKLLPLTLVVSALQALVFMFLAIAFMPQTPPIVAFAGGAIFLISFAFSITPGNVGTYEAAFVAVFVALGAATEVAIPAAILTHVVTTLTVAMFAGVALALLGLESPRGAWRPIRAAHKGGLP